jgi:regulation of enolase protein 1 (concanavalin A-like superfamily)
MQWYNEPSTWSGDARRLQAIVAPNTDFWRITHYDFIRDSGPFFFTTAAGDFEASVKVSGEYRELYHQAGLMIRIDEENWIKTGIEYVNGVQQVSAVVTRIVSDWSVVPRTDNPASVWLKLLRKGDYVEISYSFDNTNFLLLRLAYFPPGAGVQIGPFAAAPGEQSFQVIFENFTISPVN